MPAIHGRGELLGRPIAEFVTQNGANTMQKLLLILTLLCFTGIIHAQETQTPYEVALERIEEANKAESTELNLEWLGLTDLPLELWELSHLQQLNLNGNNLTTLPAGIGQLSNLQALWLYNNRLTSLPPEIGQLKNLTYLDISNNLLSDLPPEIGLLSNLASLTVPNNNLTSLPAEIGKLSNLGSLLLHNNQLTELPSEIGQLSSLGILGISENQLVSLPSNIGQLHQLCVLDIRNNQLTSLPVGLGYAMTDCKDISIQLHGNPLTQVPSEVQHSGAYSILPYLKNQAEIQAAWHLRRTISGFATIVGGLAGIGLFIRWRSRHNRKHKRKNDVP